ncbi:MAG: Zn-dependent alcohol dehydrogenase [Acidobacteria bacterium]|nr:MAG: Zn-dependent alcohol dehydrogenase [Acidobacteriota bacterium]
MRALYLGPEGLVVRRDHPRPAPREGEALIRLLRAGICSTDLELVKGYAGFHGVLGHEFVGVVEEPTGGDWAGKRVVGTINLGCRRCPTCIGDGPEHCPERTVLGIAGHDGAFADYLTLPVANLLVVPDEVDDDVAVFTEPLAAALRIRDQVAVEPSARLAVVGPGRLGLLIAQVLALTGSRLVVLGRRAASLELPRQLGLQVGLSTEAPADAFDLVVEATGNEAGLAESLRLVRPCGTLILKSTFHGAATVDLTKLVVGEVRIVGSRCGPFAPALRLLASGSVAVRPLIDGRYPLERGLEAMAHAARPGVRKILLDP